MSKYKAILWGGASDKEESDLELHAAYIPIISHISFIEDIEKFEISDISRTNYYFTGYQDDKDRFIYTIHPPLLGSRLDILTGIC